jgi:hypothetical protein
VLVRPEADHEGYVDADRVVDFADDDGPILPESTRDDTDEGWGEVPSRDADWLRDERPPHWG